MAKLNSLFKFDGTFQGVTVVKSRAYGDYMRKARTQFKLGKEMRESSVKMKQANVYAKAFKDAIDPYRLDFRDGLLWQRLVSLFKNQLQKKGSTNFSVLEGEELNKIHPLNRIISARAEVVQSEKLLKVKITSVLTQDPTQGKADGYQQTLIVLFVNADLQVQTYSESVQISLSAKPSEQLVTWTIPDKANEAILVMKCNLSLKNIPMDLQKGMGMKVVKVVGVN